MTRWSVFLRSSRFYLCRVNQNFINFFALFLKQSHQIISHCSQSHLNIQWSIIRRPCFFLFKVTFSIVECLFNCPALILKNSYYFQSKRYLKCRKLINFICLRIFICNNCKCLIYDSDIRPITVNKGKKTGIPLLSIVQISD